MLAPDPKTTEAAIERRAQALETFLASVEDYDPDDLTRVWAALRGAAENAVEWCWRIDLTGLGGDLEGLVVTEEDQTPIEVEKVCALTGETWATISPFRSMACRNAIIVVALVERRNMDPKTATDALRKVTARALVKTATQYAIGVGPFEDGPPTD